MLKIPLEKEFQLVYGSDKSTDEQKSREELIETLDEMRRKSLENSRLHQQALDRERDRLDKLHAESEQDWQSKNFDLKQKLKRSDEGRRKAMREVQKLKANTPKNGANFNGNTPARSLNRESTEIAEIGLNSRVHDARSLRDRADRAGSDLKAFFGVKDFSAEAEPPRREWVLAGRIPKHFITFLGGHSGLGKSYLLMYWAFCTVMGKSFFNLGTTRANVLWVDMEMSDEENLRRAYEIARGLELDKPPQGFYYIRPEVALSDTKMIEKIGQLKRLLECQVVILDSYTAGTPGRDALSMDDVSSILKAIEREWGTAIIIDHITKNAAAGNQSLASLFGSFAKRAIARSVLMITKADGGAITLRHEKSNFGPTYDPFHFEMAFSQKEGRTCVSFESVDELDASMAGADQHMKAYERVLYALKRLHEDSKEAWVTYDELAGDLDMGRGTVRNHIGLLCKKGLAERSSDGGKAKPIYEDDAYRLGQSEVAEKCSVPGSRTLGGQDPGTGKSGPKRDSEEFGFLPGSKVRTPAGAGQVTDMLPDGNVQVTFEDGTSRTFSRVDLEAPF